MEAYAARRYLATGDAQWLELAQAYFDFTMEGADQIWASNQLCKASWGAGILYMCTKEERYLDWTLRMADWYLQKQEDDGHWEQSLSAAGLVALPGCPYAAETDLNQHVGMTAEFVMHMAHILGTLGVAMAVEAVAKL